jgi:hypothetical protein
MSATQRMVCGVAVICAGRCAEASRDADCAAGCVVVGVIVLRVDLFQGVVMGIFLSRLLQNRVGFRFDAAAVCDGPKNNEGMPASDTMMSWSGWA